ncbi:hypothetical protein Efla_004121 [Eimeria flavescens]
MAGNSATIEGLWQWGGSFAAAAFWLPQIFSMVTMRDSYGVTAARRLGTVSAAFLSAFNMREWQTGANAISESQQQAPTLRPRVSAAFTCFCSQYAGGDFDLRNSLSVNEIRLLRLPRNRLKP